MATEHADHLVELPGATGFLLWRFVCLRGAGFPVRLVLEIGAPEAAEAADRLLERQIALQNARAHAAVAIRERTRPLAAEERRAQKRALKALRAGRIPDPHDAPEAMRDALSALARAAGELEAEQKSFDVGFESSTHRIAAALRTIAEDGRFREALTWQNRRALHTGVEALLRSAPGASDQQTRRHLAMVASYLQRYAAKNDSIGFFGPVGWGEIRDDAETLSARPGASLLASRTVYFEYWAVETLAQHLAEDPSLRPWLEPRRHPAVRIDELELDAARARALVLCDGSRRAVDVARALAGDAALGVPSEDAAREVLADLAARGLLLWTLEVPTGLGDPWAWLRGWVEGVPEPQARERSLEVLDSLERRRQAVARAAGDPAALEPALLELEEEFTRLTGASAHRKEGQAYAGRTLVYEDCRRDVELAIGPGLLASLGPPLELVLSSARWFTHEIAARYREVFRRIHAELCEARPVREVELARFRERIEPYLRVPDTASAAARPIVADVADELRARWADIFGLRDDDVGPIERSALDIRDRVLRAFDAPGPGWPGARHHSPDVLVASPSVEAVRRGESLFVLGELHAAANTQITWCFANQHPHPDSLFRARARDLPFARLSPVLRKERIGHRAFDAAVSEHDVQLESGTSRARVPRDRVLANADLVVVEAEEQLWVASRDGRHRFEVIAFFEHWLSALTMPHFGLLPVRAHTPRVTIDRLVIARETWRLAPPMLRFAREGTPRERFLGARRWAREHRLPRFLFAKIPEEPKPVYVDLASPVYVDRLAKLARKAYGMVVTEMLPSHEQCWLSDAQGERYTSELRLVCVDPGPWRPPS